MKIPKIKLLRLLKTKETSAAMVNAPLAGKRTQKKFKPRQQHLKNQWKRSGSYRQPRGAFLQTSPSKVLLSFLLALQSQANLTQAI